MLGQIALDQILLFMLYGAGAITALIACVYLVVRRGNAFAPNVTPPLRLRRWTAAFFAVLAVGHFWYLPAAAFTSDDAIKLCMLIGGLLDTMTALPIAAVVMLCMLQDRRRPLWPAFLLMMPLMAAMVWGIVHCSYDHMPAARIYMLILCIGFIIYMVHEVRRYGHWLRDNYADLEHKEVWQSFVVLTVILLVFGFYVSDFSGMAYEYIIQVCCIVLICFLLWRVETLSSLTPDASLTPDSSPKGEGDMVREGGDYLDAIIAAALTEHCVDTQLYLQHDLTVSQLAQSIGTNRFYLSQYFSNHGTTYNDYINTLRINHFVALCQEAADARRIISARQFASDSGYRSYSTFSLAFKQRMGQSVTEWLRTNRPSD